MRGEIPAHAPKGTGGNLRSGERTPRPARGKAGRDEGTQEQRCEASRVKPKAKFKFNFYYF